MPDMVISQVLPSLKYHSNNNNKDLASQESIADNGLKLEDRSNGKLSSRRERKRQDLIQLLNGEK